MATGLYAAARVRDGVDVCVKGLTDNGTLNARVSLAEFAELSLRGSQVARSIPATDIDGTDPRVHVK